jgi:hypothetical protein
LRALLDDFLSLPAETTTAPAKPEFVAFEQPSGVV